MIFMYPYVMSIIYDNMLHALDDVMIILLIDISTSHVNVHLVKFSYFPYELSFN